MNGMCTSKFKYGCLINAQNVLKIEIWTDIRFLMINKAITLGEIRY